MPSPAPASDPAPAARSRWAARLRRFAQSALTVVLLTIAALWIHELFVDPAIRQGWKLKVLMVLIPLALLASVAMGLAWLIESRSGK